MKFYQSLFLIRLDQGRWTSWLEDCEASGILDQCQVIPNYTNTFPISPGYLSDSVSLHKKQTGFTILLRLSNPPG